MAQLTEMSANALRKWIKSLEESLKVDDHEGNKQIYRKWLEEARREQEDRLARKENYLRCKGL